MAKLGKRMYMSIDDVQNEYLPISKKKIRQYIKPLPHGKIGGRLFIRRDVLEAWLMRNEKIVNNKGWYVYY